ncbi:MAG: hypothetical protein GF400_09680 [Candidatus Eisenbacteria bacterium]|nr:hypothetical protein [Candidatus Eisenbacteria bacterium]
MSESQPDISLTCPNCATEFALDGDVDACPVCGLAVPEQLRVTVTDPKLMTEAVIRDGLQNILSVIPQKKRDPSQPILAATEEAKAKLPGFISSVGAIVMDRANEADLKQLLHFLLMGTVQHAFDMDHEAPVAFVRGVIDEWFAENYPEVEVKDSDADH